MLRWAADNARRNIIALPLAGLAFPREDPHQVVETVSGLPGLVGTTPFQELGVGEAVKDVLGLVAADVEQGRRSPGCEIDDVGEGEQPECLAFILGTTIVAQREAGSDLEVTEFQPGQPVTFTGESAGDAGQSPVWVGGDLATGDLDRHRQIATEPGDVADGLGFGFDPLVTGEFRQQRDGFGGVQDVDGPVIGVQAVQSGAAGDDDRATGSGGQQPPDLSFVGGVVQDDYHALIGEKAVVHLHQIVWVGGYRGSGHSKCLYEPG